MSDFIIDPEQIREFNEAMTELNKITSGFTTTFDKSKSSVDKGIKSTDKFSATMKKLGDDLAKFSGQLTRATKEQEKSINEAKKTSVADKNSVNRVDSLSKTFSGLQISTLKLDVAFKNLTKTVSTGAITTNSHRGGLVNKIVGSNNNNGYGNKTNVMTLQSLGNSMSALSKFSGVIGRVVPLFTGLIGIIGSLVSFNKTVLKAHDDLNTFGGSLGTTSDEIINIAHTAGYTSENLDKFTTLIKRVNPAFTAMGKTSADGVRKFAEFANVSDSVREKFSMLGYSSTELTEYQADMVDHMFKMGMTLPKTTAEMKKLQAVTLARAEQDAEVMALTGQSKEQLRQRRIEAEQDIQFQVLRRTREARGQTEMLKQLDERVDQMNSIGPGLGKFAMEVEVNGRAVSEESQRIVAATQGAALNWYADVKSGRMSALEFSQKLAAVQTNIIKSYGEQAAMNKDVLQFLGLSTERLTHNAIIQGKTQEDAKKALTDSKNKEDALRKARADIQNAELNAHKALDQLANNITKIVMPAMSWFAKGLATIAKFLPGTGKMDLSIFDTQEDLLKELAGYETELKKSKDAQAKRWGGTALGFNTADANRDKKTQASIDEIKQRLLKFAPETPNTPAQSSPIGGANTTGASAQTGSSQNQVNIKDKSGNLTEKREGGSISWRNNNPGNLKMGKFALSHGAIGENGGFAVFPDMQTGEAARKSLLFETNTYKDLSVAAAISKYAPSSENDTNKYISTIASAIGTSHNTKLSSLNENQRTTMLAAMKQHEGFKEGISAQSKSPIATIPMVNPQLAAKPDATKKLEKPESTPVENGTKATDRKTTGDVHASIEDLKNEQRTTNRILEKMFINQVA